MIAVYYYKGDYQGKTSSLLEKAWYDYMPGQEMPSLEKDGRGKPFFQRDGCHLSISHTGNLWACAFSDKPVGLDIQEKKSSVDICKIAKRFFTEVEAQQVMTQGEEAFYRIWTKREAVGKLLGVGFFIPEKMDNHYTVECFMLEERVVGALASNRKEKLWIKIIN